MGTTRAGVCEVGGWRGDFCAVVVTVTLMPALLMIVLLLANRFKSWRKPAH